MKYFVKLLFCILCITSWSGCSKDDNPDLGDLSLPSDYLSQTVWKGHFEPAISDDPEKSEITITFDSDIAGSYIYGNNSESKFISFMYDLKGRVIRINDYEYDLGGYWWIISISHDKMTIATDPETPFQTKIILTKVL